jgi:hypothetical protein
VWCSALKQTIHFVRSDFKKSSRVVSQLFLDKGRVISEMKLFDFFNIIREVKKSTENTNFIFHQQRSLVNLLAAVLLRFIMRRKVRIIYDIHDLNERKSDVSFKSLLALFVFGTVEKIVINKDILLLTVSDGLANIIEEKYNKRPVVFYSIPNNDIAYAQPSSNISIKEKKIAYFGVFKRDRLPIVKLKQLVDLGFSIDLYGRFVNDTDWVKELIEFENNVESVNFKGSYKPETISKLIKSYCATLMIFDSDKLNIKYCMPNKLFQSAYSRVPCIISDNLEDVQSTFKETGGIIKFSDFIKKTDSLTSFDVDFLNDLKATSNKMYLNLL